MKRKWWVIISLCSFLLGISGTYSWFTWIAPTEEARMEVPKVNEHIPSMDKVAEAYNLIQDLYVEEVDGEQLIHGAIQGMVGTLKDPYSVYMDEVAAEQFDERLDSSFDGIGAQIAIQDGKLVVIAPIKNSPAEKAGIKAKDQITKINGESVEGLDVYQASKKIRGKKGTKVQLEIIRSGIPKPMVIEVVRDEIPLITIHSDIKESQGKKIGYIEITSFARNTAKDFATELKKLEEQEIAGLIIDVRGNPGGMLISVEEILRMFVTGEKPYVQIEERTGKRNQYYSKLNERKPYPISVLIDEGSASASEILAASMQEINNYHLIGVKTFGKGTVQQALELTEGGNIKLTMFKWLTPNGNWIHGKGIEPTIEIRQPDYFYAHPLQLEKTLEKDMNNEHVKIAQELLKGLGYGVGRTDGYFDQQTEHAVRAFQSIEKLPVTGKIDEVTATRLEDRVTEYVQEEKNDLQLQVALKAILK